jgi:hypothetical protein
MVEIKDSYFKDPFGNRYFRRNSSSLSVGAYGRKKTPLTQANYLEVDGHLNYDFLDGKLKQDPHVTIDWSRTTQSDIGADVTSYFDVGGVKGSFNRESALQAKLMLMRFHVDTNPLENILNNNAHVVRRKMKEDGNDARICSSVYVVITASLAKRFSSAADLTVEATTAQGLKITAKGGSVWSGEEAIVLGAGTVFAYGLHKVKKWADDKVGELEDDWQSFN